MGLSSVLGDLLPAALGIAISPLPIIAAVLMLLSSRPARTAPAFAAGWVLGLSIVTVVVVLVAPSGQEADSSPDTVAWIKLILGFVFAGLAISTWQRRPLPGDHVPVPPKWMTGLDTVGPVAALVLGAALSGLNPKNLALAVTGGVTMASGDLSTTETVVCAVVFVVLGSILIIGPVLAYFVAKDAMSAPLTSLKEFMQVHNAAIMTVLLTLLGVSNIGKGVGGLLQ
ncbi:MAG: GAP family protein [Aeromicrobium sp.]